eukprot:496623_1
MPLSKIQPEWENELKSVLNDAGFIQIQHVANTLQGAIYKALQISTDTKVIIKATQKFLHNNSSTIINNKLYKISENILQESIMLKTVTKDKSAPKSIVKFIDLLQCDYNYYLVQEFGGSSLFEFIVRGHLLMAKGHITIESWTNVVKIIFKQMIECIEYIHSQNVCHFDISLENMVINDVEIEIDEQTNGIPKITFLTDELQIKLCDFGLSQLFTRQECKSCRYVGKLCYESPEVIRKKKGFDPKANDLWCIGICLWSMITGCSLFKLAKKTDPVFVSVMNGHLKNIVKEWNLEKYFNDDLIDLLQKIFKYERDRICLIKIKQHKWVR